MESLEGVGRSNGLPVARKLVASNPALNVIVK
jgi:hypothetical protein